MGYLYYNTVDHGSQSQYPDWKDKSPNLKTFLDAFNLSQPIIQSQFELVMSRWPRTIFFAKNVTIPGVSANTVDINHAGFTIPIATHPRYETTEINISIIADKEGCHYYDLRNMVLQSGHPLVAGDTTADIGETEDTLEIKLRNKPGDKAYHHWTIHNWRPIKIGDVELMHDSSNFVEFEVTGTFTHITYVGGDVEQLATELSQEDIDSIGEPEVGGEEEETINKEEVNSSNDNPDTESSDEPAKPKDGKPEDWEFMSDNDKQAWELLNNGMSEDDALKEMKENIKKDNPDMSDDDVETNATAAIQNATAAMEGRSASISNLPLRFSMSIENQNDSNTSKNNTSRRIKSIKQRTIDPNHKTRNIF